jgi:DmsE family decaheme c-type cytochrome
MTSTRYKQKSVAAGIALTVGSLFALSMFAARPQQATPPSSETPAQATPPADAAAAGPATYVGSQTCQACHEDIYKAFQKNKHSVVETDKHRGFENNACESCHGPGSKHAESVSPADIRNPSKLPAAETDRTCLHCHLNQPTHSGRLQSSHAKDQVSCTACHSVHKGAEALRPRRNATINEQCATCHINTWAQFQKPHKHRLPEGAMSCVDCHNPHGTMRPRSIQTVAANDPGCFKCHADKRGPFTFEHPPVRTDNCWSCHEPHGSANPRMLNRHEIRFTCLECHANVAAGPQLNPGGNLGGVPPAFHDLRNPRFRNCTICHVKIHGSHVDRTFLR